MVTMKAKGRRYTEPEQAQNTSEQPRPLPPFRWGTRIERVMFVFLMFVFYFILFLVRLLALYFSLVAPAICCLFFLHVKKAEHLYSALHGI